MIFVEIEVIEVRNDIMVQLVKQEDMLNKLNLSVEGVPGRMEGTIEFKLEKLKHKVDLMEARSIENSKLKLS